MTDPSIQKAKVILQRLSADPATQQLARQRELGLQMNRIELSAAREEGVADGLREGEAKGLREGKADGLRAAIADLCEVLGISPTQTQLDDLARLDVAGLESLRAALKQHRAWPTDDTTA